MEAKKAGDSQLANSELRSEPDDWKRRDFLGPRSRQTWPIGRLDSALPNI